MPNLSPAGTQLVQTLASRHGVSTDAATHMLIAVQNGNGTMAQFNHPEFGGCGQWMQGGMTMVSDLFNYQLKSRVDNICIDVANELAAHQSVQPSGSFQSQSQNGSSGQSQGSGVMGSQNSLFAPDPSMNWWPQDLGSPAAVGSQNNIRYAYFPASRRLAVSTGGEAWVYDTLDHQIGGFSQQQGVGGSITFSSQFGTVNLSALPVVSVDGVVRPPVEVAPLAAPSVVIPPEQMQPSPMQPTPIQNATSQFAPTSVNSAPVNSPANNGSANNGSQSSGTDQTPHNAGQEDILGTLDRLGNLRDKGYLSDEEFAAKKSELLGRL